jgi:hypothetical protein
MATIPPVELEAINARAEGRARAGMVDIRAFDESIPVTMGAEIIDDNYWLLLDNVSPPPGLPGIPVTFAYPEDVFEKYFIPAIIIRRDDIQTDMQRWHPGATNYRVPAPTAVPVGVTVGGSTRYGFTAYETYFQGEPENIYYTVSVIAKHRQGLGLRREVNTIFKYLLSKFQAYGQVIVTDSVGDVRTYECFREGISMLDDLSEVGARQVGYALSLRVEAELDLADPTMSKAVVTPPCVRVKLNE